MYDDVINDLRAAYDRSAESRDRSFLQPWKEAARSNYLQILQENEKHTLLELGAGTGHDSLFFKENGLDVVAIDLSPKMVRFCHSKGIDAYEMDFLNLEFSDARFDAVYAFNSLLHLPKTNLGDALLEVRRVMKPGALFFMCVYGGVEQDGPWLNDEQVPKRHFSMYLDDQLKEILGDYFIIRSFEAVEVAETSETGIYSQQIILQKDGR